MRTKIIAAAVGAVLIVFAAAALVMRGKGADERYVLESWFFEGDLGEFRADMLRWYGSVERGGDVMLFNETVYDREILDVWRANGVYENVPGEEFTYIAASPAYLAEAGVRPLDGSVDAAWEGVRLYLLPNTLEESAAERLRAFLAEDALKNAERGGISNGFTERRETAFLEYAPENGGAAVYYVCTTENMTSFESESLIATGGDSYIMLKDGGVLDSLKTEPVFVKYKLKFAKESDIRG
ncbi:MAG: hypothetical protein NC299_08380 [Lachnospiraceae bacterium]|nr:hypothetical protein [Ruminococcus sp.]MCM1275370.1 hypothetical protein [Lachnospiraceae bacterium]